LIRAAILRDPKPLRKVLAKKEFVELFGEPKARMDKKPSSIFGRDDQLKNAPKLEGVDKNHKDIDLLKFVLFFLYPFSAHMLHFTPPLLLLHARSAPLPLPRTRAYALLVPSTDPLDPPDAAPSPSRLTSTTMS
jgi:hypothetical protein